LSRRESVRSGRERGLVAVPPDLVAPDAVPKPKATASVPRGSSPARDQSKSIATFAPPGNTPAKTPVPLEVVGLLREFKGHDRRVNGIAVSGDGLLALSGGQDRTVRLWKVATGTEVRRIDHDGPVTAAAMTADGRHGLSASADRTVRLWDFQSEHNVGARRLEGHTAAVFAVAFALGDQFAVSGGADKTVRVWDVAMGQASGSPLLHESAVVALATTGGDGILAGCEDGTIWLWDLTSRQRVRRLKAPGAVLCVAGTPLGNRALSGHPDGVLVLWDLDIGVEIGRMVGHNDLVRCAALLPDGHRALAGSQFGNLILWDLDSRRELRRFSPDVRAPEHAGELGIAVLADDLHALTADTDATVRLWRLPASDAPGPARWASPR
jgi:WD40 repeat protein